jgi:tetratricopeptide (TPR) repeat protein
MAKHFKVEVPEDVKRFFDAVESGRWEEIDAAHRALLLSDDNLNQPRSAELHQIWRPIQETWGAAREAHTWPAQKLLDYGEAVLSSLRPGMIYAGGTDPGCFIPTMLNDTSDSERRIVLTQNALADSTYLDYLNFLYGDQMATLTKDDSERAFQEFIADARKRLQHDEEFPNEPKQIKPGEDIKMVDNRVQVSGQVVVMAINEKLFQVLMEKNPNASFAIEQSFPFASMYGDATPLGPIMELRVQDPQNALTAERAAQSVDYWQTTAQQLLADPETPDGSNPRKAYSKMAAEQADLLLNRKYTAEAEQALQIANQICPSSPEAVFRYANLLVAQKRFDDAIAVANNAIKTEPANKQFRDLLNNLNNAKNN